jgi:ABC-type sugar transport system ATPase subunit
MTCPLELQDGHILSVMGKSGCGKTTLLRVIAGLGSADTGTITIGGRDVTGIPPQERRAVYLYQEALLFPHLNRTGESGIWAEDTRREQKVRKTKPGTCWSSLI